MFRTFSVILTCLVFISSAGKSQSLTHPHIWVTESDKQNILDNIEQHDWASSLFDQYKVRVDAKKEAHKTNPSAILRTIAPIPGVLSNRTAHTDMLTNAAESAILFYLTDDEDYAQYAADILSHYNQRLSVQESRKYNNGTGLIFNDWWLESRALFPKIAVIYDFVYDYVNNAENTVYDLVSDTRIPFDNQVAQTTVKLLSDVVLKSISAPKSNHSVLAGNGALFNLMMIDDDTTRESFFRRFYYNPNADRFDAYEWTLDNFTEQNIWDETFGYSVGSHELVIQSLNVIDRFKPELDVINKNIRIFDGYSFYENYYYPSGAIMRFGDTGTEYELLKGNQWILKAATRKNLPLYANKARQMLKFKYDEMGTYKPEVMTDRLGWWNPLQLLWGTHVSDTVTPLAPKLESTLHVDFGGMLIQRNYKASDVEKNGMMYYNGGATYVHTHSTGIDLELYGKGYVLGAESGSGSYGTDEHENYRVRLAAHNTVIANGSGQRGSNWDTKMDNVQLVACEPESYGEPISTQFSFSTQRINDSYNRCVQQRTNSIVRTSNSSGYYFDIFRSRGTYRNNFHDYIYHNIGDAVSLKYYDNTALQLSESDRYTSDGLGSVTGWTFFENVKSSNETNKAIKATFSLNTVGVYMNAFVPSGITRDYSTALAPKTKGAESGYSSKKTPVMTMRKYGEAWDEAFVAVYEASENTSGTVQSVENIILDGKVIGAIVISRIDGKEIKDYIISLDTESTIVLPEHFIKFTGRFGIVRKGEQSEDTEQITLYIGEGERLVYADIELLGGEDKKNGETFYGVQKIDSDSRFTVSTQVFGGGGTLSKSPDSVDYLAGTQVLVVANPELGYVLDTWLGDANGTQNTDTLILFSNKNVFARFRLGEYFTLNHSAENGSVAQSEEGNEFIERTCIDLTASPDEGYIFDGWSGDVTASDNPLKVCLNSNLNISANFKLETSLSKVLSNSIVVSPNPSTGIFNIKVPLANNWLVYDIAGKLLESGKSDGSFELDLTLFKKSIYLLSIRTENAVALKRLIIQ